MMNGQSNGKPARLISVDTTSPVSSKQIPIKNLVACYDKWSELCDRRIAPDLTSTDLLQFPLICIPLCTIMDVSNNYTDFYYRYWGSSLTKRTGQDMTGKSVREMPIADEGVRFYEQLNLILETKKPALFKIKLRFQTDQIVTETVLRLPLSSDNNTIEHILSFFDLGENALFSFGDLFQT